LAGEAEILGFPQEAEKREDKKRHENAGKWLGNKDSQELSVST